MYASLWFYDWETYFNSENMRECRQDALKKHGNPLAPMKISFWYTNIINFFVLCMDWKMLGLYDMKLIIPSQYKRGSEENWESPFSMLALGDQCQT